jgi:hypothetical protein
MDSDIVGGRLAALVRKYREKTSFPLVFRSICTISGFAEGTLARKNSKKIWYFARLFVPLQPNNGFD